MKTIRVERGDIIEFEGKSYLMIYADGFGISYSRQVADMTPEEMQEYREHYKAKQEKFNAD